MVNYFNEIDFSEGHECETCGWNFDNLSVAYEGTDRTWNIQRSVGCYGGFAQEYPNLDEAIKRIEEFRDEELTGKQNKQFRREINEIIEEMRKFETNRK